MITVVISIPSKATKKILQSITSKEIPKREQVLQKNEKHRETLNSFLSLKINNSIKWLDLDGVKVLYSPQDDSVDKVERTIIYLHGGGFVYGLSAKHVIYARKLAKACRANVYIVDYSLSPGVKYPIAINEIKKVIQNLTKNGLDLSKTVLAGDSAGGSLAISTILSLRTDNFSLPACAVLFSPAVDLTMSSKTYISNAKKDIILSKDLMSYFIDCYIKKDDTENPIASPNFADLNNLPPILVQVGSDEVLLEECRLFVKEAKKYNKKTTIKIGKGMWHNWHLASGLTKESSRSLKTVTDFIIGNC